MQNLVTIQPSWPRFLESRLHRWKHDLPPVVLDRLQQGSWFVSHPSKHVHSVCVGIQRKKTYCLAFILVSVKVTMHSLASRCWQITSAELAIVELQSPFLFSSSPLSRPRALSSCPMQTPVLALLFPFVTRVENAENICNGNDHYRMGPTPHHRLLKSLISTYSTIKSTDPFEQALEKPEMAQTTRKKAQKGP